MRAHDAGAAALPTALLLRFPLIGLPFALGKNEFELGTAAFVLGPARGIALLEKHRVDGFIVTPDLERFDTKGMRREYSLARQAGWSS